MYGASRESAFWTMRKASQLCQLLDQLLQDLQQGRFVLDERFEDGHSAIEMFLTEQAGRYRGKGPYRPQPQ